MKPIYYPIAFIFSQYLAFRLQRKLKRSAILDTTRVDRLLRLVKRKMISPMRYGKIDYRKHLIAAYSVSPGDTVVDAGAHLGSYSQFYASLVGNTGKVYAYEAHPFIFQHLQKKFAYTKNVDCRHFAVSKFSRKNIPMKVYPNRLDAGTATVEPSFMNTQRMPGETKIVSVPSEKLDSLLRIDPKKCYSLVKIDVQGHESSVIEGAKKLISQKKPIVIYEYCSKDGSLEQTSISQLEELGYISYDCRTLKKVSPGYVSGKATDLVAISKDRVKDYEELFSKISK